VFTNKNSCIFGLASEGNIIRNVVKCFPLQSSIDLCVVDCEAEGSETKILWSKTVGSDSARAQTICLHLRILLRRRLWVVSPM